MALPRILNKYIFKEIFISFVFSFGVFLIAGLIAGFLPLLQKGMESGLQITVILFQVLIYALPSTLVTVLPLSIMIGILLGLGRLAADNEIAAMKSAGISIIKLMPPSLCVGLLGTFLAVYCTMVLIPKGITQGKVLIREAATTKVDAGLEERTFVDTISNLVLYVDRIDSDSGILHNVFIEERSQTDEPRTITAKIGKISPDPDSKSLILDLRSGSILKLNSQGETTGGLSFESYSFKLPFQLPQSENSDKTFEEMPLRDIATKIQEAKIKEAGAPDKKYSDYYRRVVLIGKTLSVQRFTHPLACFALAVIAFPIGILNVGRSRLNNVSIGLVIIFFYYALTLSCERIARSALLPPEIILPVPPLAYTIIAFWLINLVRQEKLENPAFWMRRMRHLLFSRISSNTEANK